MPKLIKKWEELSKVPPNDKYKIVVDVDMCNGHIVPVKETEETKENYFKHHAYLSTHTFYGSQYEWSTKLLQEYGFDIEIDNWDKGGSKDE